MMARFCTAVESASIPIRISSEAGLSEISSSFITIRRPRRRAHAQNSTYVYEYEGEQGSESAERARGTKFQPPPNMVLQWGMYVDSCLKLSNQARNNRSSNLASLKFNPLAQNFFGKRS